MVRVMISRPEKCSVTWPWFPKLGSKSPSAAHRAIGPTIKNNATSGNKPLGTAEHLNRPTDWLAAAGFIVLRLDMGAF